MSRVDVLCAGTLVLDIRVEDPPDEAPLALLDKAPKVVAGGISIVSAALSRLGQEVSVCGCVGKDALGSGIRQELAKAGIGISFVSETSRPTAFSYIRLAENERFITHHIGANANLAGEGRLHEALDRLSPRITVLQYLGLLPDMERDNAKETVRFLQAAKVAGSITMVDLHTVEEMASVIPHVLPHVDIMFCNREEAEILLSSGNIHPSSSRQDLLGNMWKLAGEPSSPRLFGITGAEEACAVFGQSSGCEFANVTNPDYGSVEAVDLTGAGDNFRAGLLDHILKHGMSKTHAEVEQTLLAAHRQAVSAISG